MLILCWSLRDSSFGNTLNEEKKNSILIFKSEISQQWQPISRHPLPNLNRVFLFLKIQFPGTCHANLEWTCFFFPPFPTYLYKKSASLSLQNRISKNKKVVFIVWSIGRKIPSPDYKRMNVCFSLTEFSNPNLWEVGGRFDIVNKKLIRKPNNKNITDLPAELYTKSF